MTNPYVDPAALALSGVQIGIAAARQRGMDIPAHYLHAEACRQEAHRLINSQPDDLDGLPDDPAKLEAMVRKVAAAKGVHDAVVETAKTAAEYAARSMIMAYRTALPEFVDQLAAEFATVAADFAAARVLASDRITSDDTDEAVAAHVAMQRAAAKLDTLAAQRVSFGESVGEAALHRTAPWHVVAPPPADEPHRIAFTRDVLVEMSVNWREWEERQPVSRWTAWGNAGVLEVAAIGQVETRADAWQRRSANVGADPTMTQHGADETRAARAEAVTR